MFQNGDVDYLVATDAVGMGLNLDVDHVAFASDRKYDGYQFRRLNPPEFAQIAGRAGRATRNGTFGTTGRCAPFEPEAARASGSGRRSTTRSAGRNGGGGSRRQRKSGRGRRTASARSRGWSGRACCLTGWSSR